MVHCCVPGCKTSGTSGFCTFPANMTVAMKWIQVTKSSKLIPKLTENKLSRSWNKVCHKHFLQTDFEIDFRGKTKLKRHTIPSMFLPVDNITASSQPLKSHKPCSNVPSDNANRSSNLNRKEQNVGQNNIAGVLVDDFIEVDVNIKDQHANQADEFSNYEKRSDKGNVHKEHKNCCPWKKIALRSMKKTKILRRKLKDSKVDDVKVFAYLSTLFNEEQLQFFTMQLKNCRRKSKGHRFTDEEKSLSLALYKHSPKNYRFMQGIFLLPSKRTIGRYSAHLIFESGINPQLFEFIKKQTESLRDIDKFCILAWDEIALTAHLDYSEKRDVIDGFIELANIKRPDFATHGLAFIIRGIHTPFKQVVAYYYTDGLKSVELVEIIKQVTKAVLNTGLKVIGSTCDQTGTNSAAVHKLMNPSSPQKTPDGNLLSYDIDGNKIIHCYDPPHLIKVIRNNLQTKNLKHFVSSRWNSNFVKVRGSKAQVASWDHVSYLYHYDSQSTERLLPNISSEHIDPDKLKMRVSVATQVFSQTYGNAMHGCCERKEVPERFSDTAQVLLFFNDLYDSINCAGYYPDCDLKSAVTEDSDHFGFWYYAVEMLSGMDFIDKDKGTVNNYSSVLKKFESTVKGYIEISRLCLNLGMTDISIRNMNQDGLENFFGCVRSCGQNEKNPIPCLFRTSCTTMIVNNVSGTNSLKSNCEPDRSVPLLRKIHQCFLKFEKGTSSSDPDEISGDDSLDIVMLKEVDDDLSDIISFDPQLYEIDLNASENEAVNNAGSSVCTKILDKTNCDNCIKNLRSPLKERDIFAKIDNPNDVILTSSSSSFMSSFKILLKHLNYFIPHICCEKLLKKKLLSYINPVKLNGVGCPNHSDEVIKIMKEYSVDHAIKFFCKNVNDLLSDKVKTLPKDSNFIQDAAFTFQQKKKRIGKYTDKFSIQKRQ